MANSKSTSPVRSEYDQRKIAKATRALHRACSEWENNVVFLEEEAEVDKWRSVYIIELDDSVATCKRCLRNLGVNELTSMAVYVGSTVRTIEQRIEQHLAGFKSSHMVKKHFKRHMSEWELQSKDGTLWRNRLDTDDAAVIELGLVPELLRKHGFAVHAA